MTLVLLIVLGLTCAWGIALWAVMLVTTRRAFRTGRPVKRVSVSPLFRCHVEFWR